MKLKEEINVVLLGEPAVGKTSLINALKGEPIPKTHIKRPYECPFPFVCEMDAFNLYLYEGRQREGRIRGPVINVLVLDASSNETLGEQLKKANLNVRDVGFIIVNKIDLISESNKKDIENFLSQNSALGVSSLNRTGVDCIAKKINEIKQENTKNKSQAIIDIIHPVFEGINAKVLQLEKRKLFEVSNELKKIYKIYSQIEDDLKNHKIQSAKETIKNKFSEINFEIIDKHLSVKKIVVNLFLVLSIVGLFALLGQGVVNKRFGFFTKSETREKVDNLKDKLKYVGLLEEKTTLVKRK